MKTYDKEMQYLLVFLAIGAALTSLLVGGILLHSPRGWAGIGNGLIALYCGPLIGFGIAIPAASAITKRKRKQRDK